MRGSPSPWGAGGMGWGRAAVAAGGVGLGFGPAASSLSTRSVKSGSPARVVRIKRQVVLSLAIAHSPFGVDELGRKGLAERTRRVTPSKCELALEMSEDRGQRLPDDLGDGRPVSRAFSVIERD